MADSDNDSLDDMLLQAGGAGKASNKRARSEDVFDDSDADEAASESSQEVSQAVQSRGNRGSSKRSKTDEAGSSKIDPNAPFNEDAFMFDGYGKSLIRDEADAEMLDAMNELDREMELSGRAELRDKELERMRNARLLMQAKEARAKHTDAAPPQPVRERAEVREKTETTDRAEPRERSEAAQSASDKADQMRSSTRLKRPDSGKVDAMAELRARRAQAQERQSTKESARKRSKRSRSQDDDESYTDDEEISESDSDDRRMPSASVQEASASELSGPSPRRMSSDEEVDRREQDRYPRDRMAIDEEEYGGDVQASNAELLALQIKRHKLEKWVREPFFDKTVTGCLVKVAYNGKYHVAEVVDVQSKEPGKTRDMGVNMTYPYQFGAGVTSKVLIIRRGTNDRVCPMTQVSNQAIDVKELDSLVLYMEEQRVPHIMRSNVEKQKALLKDAENYTYTSEDVNKMLAEKRAKGTSRGMNSAVEKARLTRLRDHALEANDVEQVQQIEEELQRIEAQLANAERNANKRGFGMSNVNERNKKTNFLNAYKNVSSAPENQKVSATGADAFSRRKTQSKVYWSTVPKAKRDELQAAAAAAGTTVQINPDGTAVLPAAAIDGVNLAGIEVPAAAVRTNADGDVIDLDIDMSVLEAIPERVIMARKLLGPQYPFVPKLNANLGSKKLLSFAEYIRQSRQLPD